jgi:hypothetical protein
MHYDQTYLGGTAKSFGLWQWIRVVRIKADKKKPFKGCVINDKLNSIELDDTLWMST